MILRTNSVLYRLALRLPSSLFSVMSARVGYDYSSFATLRLWTRRERQLNRNYRRIKPQ